MTRKLSELIDIPNLQMLMDRFYAATGIPVGILDPDGDILVATGWQEICTHFHRVHPVTAERCRQSDAYIKDQLNSDGFVDYKCLNGLWDLAVPIVIAGEHVGTLFLGQFFYDDEAIDEEFFRRQALEFGFEVDGYLAALRRIPVFSREKVRQIMAFYTPLVNFVVSTGLANIQRAEAEKALRESEEKFAAAFQTAPISMNISTLDEGRYLDVNEEFERQHGYPRAEVVGKTAADLTLWCDLRERQEIIAQLTRGEAVRNREITLCDRDGRLRYGLYSGAIIDLHGEKHLLALRSDITARKQAEKALRTQFEQMCAIFDAIEAVLYVADMESHELLYLNSYGEALFGADWQGKKCFEALQSARSGPCAFCTNDRLVCDDQIQPPLVWESHNTLTGHWYQCIDRALTWKDGRLVRLEIAFDISERKKTEMALRESEDKFSRIFRSTPTLLAISTMAEGRFLEINYAVEEMLGYEPEEIIGHTSQELGLWETPETRDRLIAVFREQGKVRGMEVRLRTKSGKIIVVLFSAEVIEVNGEPRLLSLLNDITELKRYEKELAEAKEAAEAASRAKSEFLANMSHEIRTPMNGIMGMTQLLEQTELSSEQQQYLEAIRLSSESLLSLISDVLDLSKIEAGKVELERTAFSLRGTVNDLLKTQMFLIHSKGLTIETAIPDDIPDPLTGDQLRLKQVLLNLLGNAVKFTDRGGITLTVRMEERQHHTVRLRFSVTDTGIGIKPEVMEKIFTPFSQADASTTRNFGGTGLGLPICTRLTELMGGSIDVESTEGVGSTFHVVIPFAVNELPMERKDRSENRQFIAWEGDPLRILLVEDNEINRTLFIIVMRQDGHILETAENGREALTKWQQHDFDIILMDIQMPEMDGIEATRIIREEEMKTGRHVPIIALTAHAMSADQKNFLNQGFDGYVSKPVKFNLLNEEIRRCLKGR